MRSFHLLLCIALAGASPIPATAKQAQSQDIAADSFDKQLQDFGKSYYSGNYDAALEVASKLEVADNQEGRALKSALRATALLSLKRTDEARRLFAEADRLWPTEPFVATIQLEAGLYADQPDVTAQAFDRLVARFPDALREVDYDLLKWFIWPLAKQHTTENDDRLIALARLGYGADASHGDFILFEAVNALMKRGNHAGASELAGYIDEPELIQNMLIGRRFEPIWSTVERRAGPRLENVRRSSVNSAQKAYDKEPTSNERLAELANALVSADRKDDVIALRSKLPSSAAGFEEADEHLGWTVNAVAMALYEKGRTAEADQLFKLLNDAKAPSDNWRVSMKINRVYLLVREGSFDKALPLLESTDKVPGSDYAKQLVRRQKYCTLAALGRAGEAATLLPDINEHSKDAVSATVDALICANRLDEAEKLILDSFYDDRFQEEFIREMQPVKLKILRRSIWSDGWDNLRKRPALQKEFERLGRPMPKEFLYSSPGETG